MKLLYIQLGKEIMQRHITKQLVHSFSVNIMISQPLKVMFTSVYEHAKYNICEFESIFSIEVLMVS